MHYLIDGYNLLFRVSDLLDDFSSEREQIIRDLNHKIQLLKLDASIIFDAHYCPGESSRAHYKHLEILFSGEGETADELILKLLKATKTPSHYTVVTSDNRLAWKARRLGGKTEKVEAFLIKLNKRYINALNKFKKEKEKKLPIKRTTPTPPSPPAKKVKKPTEKARPEECFDYYLYIFEKQVTKGMTKKSTEQSDMERWLKIFEEKSSTDP